MAGKLRIKVGHIERSMGEIQHCESSLSLSLALSFLGGGDGGGDECVCATERKIKGIALFSPAV